MTQILLPNEQRLIEEFDELGLEAMGSCFKDQLEHPENYGSMDFVERISTALNAYRVFYKDQQCQKLIQQANLKMHHRLDDFSTYRNDGITKDVIQRLRAAETMIKESRTVFIGGPCGVGKTALACAAAMNFMENEYPAKFFKLSHLIQDLSTKTPLGLKQMRSRMRRLPVLIIDDIGTEKIKDPGASRFFDVIDERCGQGVTIITSQVCMDAIPKIFDSCSKHIMEAVKDRLLPQNTYEILLTGKSKRGASFELK